MNCSHLFYDFVSTIYFNFNLFTPYPNHSKCGLEGVLAYHYSNSISSIYEFYCLIVYGRMAQLLEQISILSPSEKNNGNVFICFFSCT
jgi:hypothetical protein